MGIGVAQIRSQGKHGLPWLVSIVRCGLGAGVLGAGLVGGWSGFVGWERGSCAPGALGGSSFCGTDGGRGV